MKLHEWIEMHKPVTWMRYQQAVKDVGECDEALEKFNDLHDSINVKCNSDAFSDKTMMIRDYAQPLYDVIKAQKKKIENIKIKHVDVLANIEMDVRKEMSLETMGLEDIWDLELEKDVDPKLLAGAIQHNDEFNENLQKWLNEKDV